MAEFNLVLIFLHLFGLALYLQCKSRTRHTREALHQWAMRNGYHLVDASENPQDIPRSLWFRAHTGSLFKVTVLNREGKARKGWVRFWNYHPIRVDRFDVVWAADPAPSPFFISATAPIPYAPPSPQRGRNGDT